MEIRIEGSRSTAENWRRAQSAPEADLPGLSDAEIETAKHLGIPATAYARNRYAVDLTDIELAARIETFTKWVSRWLSQFAGDWTITEAGLSTIEGKLRLKVSSKSGDRQTILISEDLIDELLNEGSTQASEALTRLLQINLDVPVGVGAA